MSTGKPESQILGVDADCGAYMIDPDTEEKVAVRIQPDRFRDKLENNRRAAADAPKATSIAEVQARVRAMGYRI